MKKRFCLYITFILVFNLILPFAMKPFTAEAAVRNFRARNSAYLVRGNGDHSTDWPSFKIDDPNMPSQRAVVSWEMGPAADFFASNVGGLYVLRYYDNIGDRIEMTVEIMQGRTGVGGSDVLNEYFLMVDYNVYEKWPDGTYRSINDPLWGRRSGVINPLKPTEVKPRSLDYRIYKSDTRVNEPVFNYFNRGFDNGEWDDNPDNNPNWPDQRTYRVNNREQYTGQFNAANQLGQAPSNRVPPHADIHPNYPLNPNFAPRFVMDPDNPNTTPAPGNDPPRYESRAYLDSLSPSFNIHAGRGYTFEYAGKTVSFLWDAGIGRNDEFVFDTSGISNGNIYDFELEYYPPGQTKNYYLYGHTNSPLRPAVSSDNYYIHSFFPGFNLDTISILPFAQYIDTETNPTTKIPIHDPDTDGPYDKVPHTSPEYYTIENRMNYVSKPYYNTDDIYLEVPAKKGYEFDPPDIYGNTNAQIKPAADDNGIDIRFDLPRRYDPVSGKFIPINHLYNSANPNDPRNLPEIRIRFVEGWDPVNSVDITVEQQAWNIPEFRKDPLRAGMNYNDYENENRDANGRQIVSLADGTNGRIRDASLLKRANEPDGYADRVRIKVGGLAPGTYYPTAYIILGNSAILTGNMTQLTGATTSGSHLPAHTFLDYDVKVINGNFFIEVIPFGMISHENLPEATYIDGWYRLEVGVGGNWQAGYAATYSEGNKPVLLSIPAGVLTGGAENYRIAFARNRPGVGSTAINYYSQNIIFQPGEGTDVIRLPNNFRVIKDGSDYHYNLVPRVPQNALPYGAHADLDFWLEWELGRYGGIGGALNEIERDNAERALTGLSPNPVRIAVEYDIYRNRTPAETTEDIPPKPHPSYNLFDKVHLLIERPDPGKPTDLFISFRDYPENNIPGSSLIDWGLVAEKSEAADKKHSTAANPLAWYPLEMIQIPLLDPPQWVCFTKIPFTVPAVASDSPAQLPPEDNFEYQFVYPNIYFLNVRPIKWMSPVRAAEGVSLSHLSSSKFDYITLDTISSLSIPPPINLRVKPGVITPSDGGRVIDSLDVSYVIPSKAIRDFLHSQYPMDPEVTVDLYIGQFENDITEKFYQETRANVREVKPPLSLDERKKLSYVIDYETSVRITEIIEPNYLTKNLRVLDFSGSYPEAMGGRAAVDLRQVLRGEYEDRTRPPGITRPDDFDYYRPNVVSVQNIPLFLPAPDYEPVYYNPNGGEAAWRQALNDTLTALASDLLAEFSLMGLDENQKYYMFADLVITPYPKSDPNTAIRFPVIPQEAPHVSLFTGIVAETTIGTEYPPNPGENSPPAPRNINSRNTTETSTNIYWDAIRPEAGAADVSIEYEIVRLKDSQMTEEEFKSTDIDFTKFFRDLPHPDKAAWRTNGLFLEERLEVYANGAFTKVNGTSMYIWDPDTDPVNLTDKTLSPNNLYFFYVRTVRIVNVYDPQIGTPENGYMVPRRVVSSWSRTSVTSEPVRGPTNLVIEDGREFPELYPNFDPKTEVVISWESTLSMAEIAQRMGRDYIFQYQIKADDGEWSQPINMEVKQLINPKNYEETRNGTTKFTYRIQNLNPSTGYQVRVRLYDILMSDGSLYSNIESFRTDFDQGEYDDDKGAGDWLRYLRELLEKMLRDPYWVTFESRERLNVVYRPDDMFNGLLLSTPGSVIELYNNGADDVSYYFPVSVIQQANSAGKGFLIRYGDMDIYLSPKLLLPDQNDYLAEMARLVKNKRISDYFVRVTVLRSEVRGGAINNNPVLGKQAGIEIAAVGTINPLRSIRSWDQNVYTQAANMVDQKVTDPILKQNFINQINAGSLSEELSDYVDQLVVGVRNELMRTVNSQIRVNESGTHFINGILSVEMTGITQLDAAMQITARVPDANTVVNGFRLQPNNTWASQPVIDFNNGKAMTQKTTGTFAFTGRAVNIPGIEEVPKGGTISAFTAKYGLEDYLGRDGVDLQRNASRYMVAGCVARMAGAPSGADPVSWISNNLNVTLSSRNTDSLVQNQEAIAVVMALYEKKTNTKIATLTIRNQQATAGMAGLDSRYAQAVRAAFELGIVSDKNLRPAGSVTIGGLLDLLASLDGKVRL